METPWTKPWSRAGGWPFAIGPRMCSASSMQTCSSNAATHLVTAGQHIDVDPFLRQGYQIFPQALDSVSLEPIRQFLQSHVDRQVDSASREIGCGSRREFAVQIAAGQSA